MPKNTIVRLSLAAALGAALFLPLMTAAQAPIDREAVKVMPRQGTAFPGETFSPTQRGTAFPGETFSPPQRGTAFPGETFSPPQKGTAFPGDSYSPGKSDTHLPKERR